MLKRKRLIWQLYPSYLIPLLVALLAIGWYGINSMRQFYLEQTRQNLLAQAQLLSNQLTDFLKNPDHSNIDDFCKQISQTVSTRLTVILPSGIVLGDSDAAPATMENHADRPEIREALADSTGYSLRYSATLGQLMMYVALPLKDNDIRGVIRVSLAVTAIEKKMTGLMIRIGLGGLVIALLISVACLIISKRISRPIESMRQGAERFAKGDLTHRLQPPDTAELAALAYAMNQMAHELELRIQAVIRQGKESEAVLSSMVEGVMALDMEEHITHANGAAAGLFNSVPEKLQGSSIQAVIRNRHLHQMIRSTLTHGQIRESDISLFHDKEKILNVRCTPLLGDQGHRTGTLLVINDVTRLRRLEMIRSEFAANVSHEIKTPLTAIKGFVHTLLHASVNDPLEAKRFLGIINRHVDRLTAIIDDLMQLSRLEQSDEDSQLRLERTSVKKVIASAIQICRSAAQSKTISFIVNCDKSLQASMDTKLMEQALVNVLDNAIKYSREGSHIEVSVQSDGDKTTIHIQDEGIGIAAQHLPRLFERFYRVDKARSRRLGGTGLGLAIVKHIVQVHDGVITVESTPGRGSTFTIHLPTGNENRVQVTT